MRPYVVVLLILVCTIPMLAGEKGDERVAERPWLGMALSIRESPSEAKFLYVARVAPDTPASRAGVQPGDIVMRLGDRSADFKDELELLEFVSGLQVDARLELTLIRAGEEVVTDLVVGRLPESLGEAGRRRSKGRGPQGKQSVVRSNRCRTVGALTRRRRGPGA